MLKIVSLKYILMKKINIFKYKKYLRNICIYVLIK
jgi:hypothetical protein